MGGRGRSPPSEANDTFALLDYIFELGLIVTLVPRLCCIRERTNQKLLTRHCNLIAAQELASTTPCTGSVYFTFLVSIEGVGVECLGVAVNSVGLLMFVVSRY